MANWQEELSRAAQKLSDAADKLGDARGGANRLHAGQGGPGSSGQGGVGSLVGGLSGGRGFLAAAGPAGIALAGAGIAADAIAAGARFATTAANAYAVTGSAQAFASGITSSLVGAAENTALGGLLLGATGISAARGTNQRAGAATLDVTEDLARIGVSVSEEQRQRFFDRNQEIEKRVTEERGKVEAIQNSAKELDDAKPAGAGGGFDRIAKLLESIEGLLRRALG